MDRRSFLAVLGAVASPALATQRTDASWRAGVASADITPGTSLWMAGFARRKHPSQGTALPLHAKALALQSGRERPAVIVTVDLLGLTERITSRVAATVRRRHALPRANLL